MTGIRRPECVEWSDPTGERAIAAVPEALWQRIVAMLEYLHATYGNHDLGPIRGDGGRMAGSVERPIVHGTRGGYLAHVRRRIPPCRACSDANTAETRRRRDGR